MNDNFPHWSNSSFRKFKEKKEKNNRSQNTMHKSQNFEKWEPLGHSGEYGNGAKLVGKMSKSVMQLISIHF